MMRLFNRVLIFSMLMMTGFTTQAGCRLSTGDHHVVFGQLSSLEVAQRRQTAHAGDAGLLCSGAFLSVLGFGNLIEARITSAHQGQLLKAGTQDSLPYHVYADPSYSRSIDWNRPFNYFETNLLDLLGLLGGSQHAMPIFVRTDNGAFNLSPGHYTDQLHIQWRWNICEGIGLLGLCIGRDRGSSAAIIQLELEVAPDCIIEAPNIEFGSAPLVGGFNPVTQTLSVRCSKGAAYSVGLNNGQQPEGTQRRMRSGRETLAYEVYKGLNGHLRWGHEGSERRSDSSAELAPAQRNGLTAQGFVYHAEVLPSQPTPPPGRYQDSLVVDVAF